MNFNFDTSSLPPADSFDPLPPGWYTMVISGASEQEPREGSDAGTMLKLEHEIDPAAHPQFAGRKVWSVLCINHGREQPRMIAQRTLAAIGQAIGKPKLTSADDLLGQSLSVKLAISPAKDGFDARNDVKGYRAASGAQPVAPARPTAAPQPAAKPWGGKR